MIGIKDQCFGCEIEMTGLSRARAAQARTNCAPLPCPVSDGRMAKDNRMPPFPGVMAVQPERLPDSSMAAREPCGSAAGASLHARHSGRSASVMGRKA